MTMRKYVPGVAPFYFKPDFSWSAIEAKSMYEQRCANDVDEVYFEDCINGMKRLKRESIDLIIADPPFALEFTGKERFYNRDSGLVQEKYVDVPKNDYLSFSNAWISELPRLMKRTASAFIFSGWSNLRDVLIAIEESGLKMINHLIWKYQFAVFTKRKFASSHYHLLWLARDEKRYFFNRIEHYSRSVWEIKRTYDKGKTKNATKLPNEIVERCIRFCSKPGDTILDTFMGNGTTAVVAKKLYRHFIGFEINREMKKIIRENIKNARRGELF